MLSGIMINVVMLCVIMLSVVAPFVTVNHFHSSLISASKARSLP
jgi:hypothetical protein